jgi:hypothetical protein
MITVGDFLKSFVKYANETPNALVYTDLAPWESGNSAYCYVKSLMLKDGAVLLDCINEDFIDKNCCLNAETILKFLQQQDPSLQLCVDCGGKSLPVDRDEVDEVLEYDQQDPKEIFFYTDTRYDDDFDGDFN